MNQAVVGQVLAEQDERRRLKEVERARRVGHKFIRVVCKDPAFFRMHSIHTIRPIVSRDSNGKEKYEFISASGVLECVEDELSGQLVQDVLDDEYNRFFLARHLDIYEVQDRKVADEIDELVGEPYSVELSEEQDIDREIDRLAKKKQAVVEEREKKAGEKKKRDDAREKRAEKRKAPKRKAASDSLNEGG